MDDYDFENLNSRVARIFGDKSIDQAMIQVRAIVGPSAIPDTEPLAQSALEKLKTGEIPDPSELVALEIVIRVMRPVVVTKNGIPADLPRKAGSPIYPHSHYDDWDHFKTTASRCVNSIGRIEQGSANNTFDHIGTGFLVGDDILATNQHVLDRLTFGTGILTANSARVVFKHEYGQKNDVKDIVAIKSVAARHPHLDMVLLEVEGADRPPLQIDDVPAKAGDEIVAIGYPAKDVVNNPVFLNATFQGKFGVRCAALGEVLKGVNSPSFHHDCSTTQGNSGSPILSLKTAEVIGMHRSGFFMYCNEAIDAPSLANFVAMG